MKESDDLESTQTKSTNEANEMNETEELLESQILNTENFSQALSDLENKLKLEQEKSTDYWNRLLQKEAELQNFAKRSRLELEQAKKFGPDNLAKDLISVVDSLEQGIETAPKSDEAQPVLEGLILVQKSLLDTLAKYEVKQINPLDEAFNPDWHEAIATQPSADKAPNTILIVIQKGYSLHGRLVRPARVIVSSAAAAE